MYESAGRRSRPFRRSRSVHSLSTSNVLSLTSPSRTVPLAYSSLHHLKYVSEIYRPKVYNRYWQDSDIWDDYAWDSRHYMSPLYWSTYYWPLRRYYYYDLPYSWNWYYPTISYYPRYSRSYFLDSIDPVFWRRYDNYRYYPQWWKYRSEYDYDDVKSRIRWYRRNILDYDSLERYWLRPRYLDRISSIYSSDSYRPVWYSSPRRYYYSFSTL
ncbi:unnamed protein product [Soboliphyme baturini]|uniref:Uncharacterized protein n=1 Tax=Soboliphyme baturini TaxID=241478 RepID=A0A183J1T7_9BILA|nr:unnamed protein product [Soboliphyme baturini]